jgi:hypothetical protein
MSLFNQNNEFDSSTIQSDDTYSTDFSILNEQTQDSYTLTLANVFICVHPESLILMHDKTLKMIKDIRRNDIIIQDIATDKKATVSIVTITPSSKLVSIPSLLDNTPDLIITYNHPVWINNDDNRIFAEKIKDAKEYKDYTGNVYNLQFDEEGTYYANGFKIDSLSPYHCQTPLSKDNFIDDKKYQEGIVIRDENDSRRNKPLLI